MKSSRYPIQHRTAAAISKIPDVLDSSSSWETLRLSTSTSHPKSYQRSRGRDPSWRFDADDEDSPPPLVRRKLIDSFDELVQKETSFHKVSVENDSKNPASALNKSWLTSSPLLRRITGGDRHNPQDFVIPSSDEISVIPKMREVRFMTPSKDTEEQDIIVLDDEEEEQSTSSSRQRRKHQLESPRELVTFHQQPVTEHDYKTLGEDEFLNDNIVNFYLTWLYEQLDEKYKNMIHIYSSHFYTRLRSKPDKKDKRKELEKAAGGKIKTKAEKAYEKVKGWTKKINIFDKRMLIFPICEESHWYLVIVCNHGLVLSKSSEKDYEVKRSYQQKYGETKGSNPFIMVLDSLGGSHSTALSKIRSYLTFEHLEKKTVPKNFGKEKMAEKHPPIPLQPNSCDCGLFLLHYVELIFKDPDEFLGAMLPDLSRWFNTDDIIYKREDIALLIQKIANESVRFPRIKFPARRKDQQQRVNGADFDEDAPLISKRRVDPRLRKLREGSLGQLLASKQPSRSTRFTGNYGEPVIPDIIPPPPPRISSRRRSPSPSPEREGSRHRRKRSKSPQLYDSPVKISFELKKRKYQGPKSPNGQDFSSNGKRFTLKRNNVETDPDTIRKKKKYDNSDDEEQPAKSGREMFDLLMKSTSKKSKRM